ncbi:MAG: methyltransferase domain-containing protein [Oscillatoria princeps RMCB-10]|jgi:SAM-dependent methyltransferase|nr:methyltransferase domain-containing protein [Oscillatoria princeps RMCB-10]
MSEVESPNFWEARYQEGAARWDIGQPAPAFVKFLNSPGAPVDGRVAVLGCGRGYEALLFASRGFEVVGFDFAPSAIAAASRLAQAAGISARFLQRDIFDLVDEFTGYFDFVVEHTCFCAISQDKRQEYVRLVNSILTPGGELIGLFFTHSRAGGPPFGVTPAEIEKYFAGDFDIISLAPPAESVPARQGEEHFALFRRK